MKRSTIARTFTIAAVSALVLGSTPAANAADKRYSIASLQGTFAYTGTGFIVTPAAFAGPFAEVGTQTFDGNGATTTFTASQNGNMFQATLTGTYTVKSDCTGTFTLSNPDLGLTVTLFFVIDDNLNEFQAVETLPGAVVTPLHGSNFQRRLKRIDGFRPWRRKNVQRPGTSVSRAAAWLE
jgi:hypothetical protein